MPGSPDRATPPAGAGAPLRELGEAWSEPVALVERVLEEPEPGERARRLTELLSDAQTWVSFLSVQRDSAVLLLRQSGASYDVIARALGVTKSRAQQIVRRLEQGAAGGGAPG